MKISRQFITRYSVFLIAVAAALFCWNQYAPAGETLSLAWFIFAFFSVLTPLLYIFITRSADDKPGIFVRRFTGSTTAKLLACMMVIVLYSISNPKGAVVFVAHFFALYLVFTVFEIAALYRFFRERKK